MEEVGIRNGFFAALKVLICVFFAVALVEAEGLCGNKIVNSGEECDDGNDFDFDGCSACKVTISRPVYIISYVGDIDGVGEDWYYVYEKFADFYDEAGIKGSFSFYPGSMTTQNDFARVFIKMYKSEYIELVQRGFIGDDVEKNFDKLAYAEQRKVVEKGRAKFVDTMSYLLNENKVEVPIVYNHITGRLNSVTQSVLEDMGFVMYLEMYKPDDAEPTLSSHELDVIQHGVSFTTDGSVGRNSVFDSPANIINRINTYKREDLPIIEVKGAPVIPIWVQHYHFELPNIDNGFDFEKWRIYTETLIRLKNDPLVSFVNGADVYSLKRESIPIDRIFIESNPKTLLKKDEGDILGFDAKQNFIEEKGNLIFTVAIVLFFVLASFVVIAVSIRYRIKNRSS